jgi:hypothetical protein
MTRHAAEPLPPPLSRPLAVEDVPAAGLDVTVEATEAEREALARDFGLAGLARLVGRFAITGTPRRLKVSGRVEASLTQTCVVTLDPFDSDLTEDFDLIFAEPRSARTAGKAAAGQPPATSQAELSGEPQSGLHGEARGEPPDDIIDGKIDLGALTAEFLALGLDPHPRKPGAAFEPGEAPTAAATSPFAALAKLKS